jgi:hypothetical protein
MTDVPRSSETGVTASTGSPQPPMMQDSASGISLPEVPNRALLADMLSQVEADAERRRKQVDILNRREQILFVSLLFVAAFTVIIATSGVVLIFLAKLTVGIVSGATGLLTGTGTVVLRNMGKQLERRQNELAAEAKEDADLIKTIRITYMINDPDQQNAAFADLATRLRARIGSQSAVTVTSVSRSTKQRPAQRKGRSRSNVGD